MLPRASAVAGLCLLALSVVWLVAASGSDIGHRVRVRVELIPRGNSQPQGRPPFETPRRGRVRVTAIGDSVLLAASDTLKRSIPGIDIDAVVGRSVEEGISALSSHAAADGLGDTVLVHLGNNGQFTDEQFEEIVAIVGPHRALVFVTVRVPRSWEAPNNDVIVKGVARHANAVLVDWRRASANDPAWLWDDGVHLRPAGAFAYAQLLLRELTRP